MIVTNMPKEKLQDVLKKHSIECDNIITVGPDKTFDLVYPDILFDSKKLLEIQLGSDDYVIIDPNGGGEKLLLVAMAGFGTICPIITPDCQVIENTTCLSLGMKLLILGWLLRDLKTYIEALQRFIIEERYSEEEKLALENSADILAKMDLQTLEQIQNLQKIIIEKTTKFLD